MVSQLTGRTPGGGNKVALVLGSGGARGYAHIGVIEALEARGFEIISIAGCSMGALIGGIYASGKLPEYREWVCNLDYLGVLKLVDVTWSPMGAPCLWLIPARRICPPTNGEAGW